MSTHRRAGGNDRTTPWLTPLAALLWLSGLWIMDALGTGYLIYTSVHGSWRDAWAVRDFSNAAGDMGLMVLLRLLLSLFSVLVAACCLKLKAPGLTESAELEAGIDSIAAVATQSVGEFQYSAVSAEEAGRAPQSTEGAFLPFRQASLTYEQHQLFSSVIFYLFFILCHVCNGVVAVKCLFFHFSVSPYQQLAMASTVVWVNLEVVLLGMYLDACISSGGLHAPAVHQHPLRFNCHMVMTRCDECGSRVRKEGFSCVSCSFDCCLPCYCRRSQEHSAHLPRNARGPPSRTARLEEDVGTVSYGRRAFALLMPFWFVVMMAVLSLVLTELSAIAMPNFQGKVIDSVIRMDQPSLTRYLKYFVILSLVRMSLGSLRSFCISIVLRNVRISLGERLFSSLLFRDIPFFDGSTVGSLTARMTNDVQAMVSPINAFLNNALSNFICLIGGLIMCLLVSWQLTLITFSVIGPIIYLTKTHAAFSAKLNRGVWDALAEANSIATESFSNIRTIRTFSTENHEIQRYKLTTAEVLRKTLLDAAASCGTYFTTNALNLAANALVLGFGGYMAIQRPEDLTVGKLVTFQLYTSMLNNAYQSLNGVINDFTRSSGAAKRVLSLLDVPSECGVGEIPDQLLGDIALERVTFAYQHRADCSILRQLCCCFPRNTVTAIVGRPGSGKSTLMNLLLRHYHPTEGHVLLDRRDIRSLNLQWLHDHTAVVAQDTQLFNSSIESNIAYGLENYRQEDLLKASRKANAHDFIEGFPDGYGTLVGERGVRLTGGQRQRIAIARALLRNPRILLVDEATSALDAEAEAQVQASLDQLISDLQHSLSCTIVVIAHRLSTVVKADNIIVMEDGGIAEQGTHEQLLQNQGPYAKLISRQLHVGGNLELRPSSPNSLPLKESQSEDMK